MATSDLYTRLILDKKGWDKNLVSAQKNLKGFKRTSEGVFKGLSKFAGYAVGIAGVSKALHAAMVSNIEFEKSLSSLRSLTGVSAKELNYFRVEAIHMAMNSTQSAKDMVEAYKLIGSQMPELLKNKEALSATAKAAVTLAEAAELDVPTAAKALTGSLNQMGQSSAHAAEYINILAAASQQGSADIPYLNRAIEKSGGAASSVGVKFNELVAAIEAIAPKVTEASEAGTHLRNIFLTLEGSTNQKLKPSVVGLSTALKNLADQHLNATELTKMFGKESVTAAMALLTERDAYEKLRVGIEDTNTAYEQAQTNTDNLSGSITRMGNAWTAFVNSMSESNGIIKQATDTLTTLINKANETFLMSGDEQQQYRNEKKYGKQAEAVNKNSQRWIEERVRGGADRKTAIEDEMAAMGRMYPEALKYEERLSAYEAAKAEYSKGWTQERKKELNATTKAYNIAERQKYIYDYVLSNLQSQVTEIQEKAEAEKEAARAAKEKAAAEKAAKAAEEAKKRPIGSIAELDAKISTQRKEYERAATDEARVAVMQTIRELETKKIHLQAVVETQLFQKGKTPPPSVEQGGSNLASLAGGIEMPKIEIPSLKPNIKDANDYADSLYSISDAVSSLSSSFGAGNDSVLTYFASVVDGATKAASAIMMLIPVKKEEANASMLSATTGAASAVAGIPFAGPMMAISAIASLVAAIAAVPKFANGGIIGGSSYMGDKLLARVNSGEMILNKRQQSSLYRMTDGAGGNVTIGVDKVRGADLYLSIKNYMKQTGKRL